LSLSLNTQIQHNPKLRRIIVPEKIDKGDAEIYKNIIVCSDMLTFIHSTTYKNNCKKKNILFAHSLFDYKIIPFIPFIRVISLTTENGSRSIKSNGKDD